MKITALGDIHGRAIWKQIVEENMDSDKIVFQGDYFDTHENISVKEQMENFADIAQFKRFYPDKVVLLFGNHDFHYLRGIGMEETYSGYNAYAAPAISILLHRELECMQMCFAHKELLFSHAGVTKTWKDRNEVETPEDINELFVHKPRAFKFTSGINQDPYGDDITQSPIWVRPRSLEEDGLTDFIHIVGHTTVPIIKQEENIILIDALPRQYLVWEDGTFTIKNI